MSNDKIVAEMQKCLIIMHWKMILSEAIRR